MSMNYNIPLKQGLLKRSRIDMLLECGLDHPLVTVLAGPGYGKTQAVANYLNDKDVRLVWLRLTDLDNLPSGFWNDLILASEKAFPILSKRMRSFEFPDTLAKLEAFLRVFTEVIYDGKPVVWVIDDFSMLKNPAVMKFFETIIAANLENFCMILISTSQHGVNQAKSCTDHSFSIGGDELRFTIEEMADLFNMHGKPLGPDELEELEKFTEGWALPIHLMLLHTTTDARIYFTSSSVTNDIIYQMFRDQFFAGYSEDMQKLLVKLSLLDGFTKKLLHELFGALTEDETGAMWDNVFISYAPAVQMYSFHMLYKSFLRDQGHLISAREERELYQAAGGHFSALGMYIEAINCYRKCEDYKGMLGAMLDFANTRMSLTPEIANFFMEHLDLLSPEQVERYPVANYLRAHIYMNTLQIDRADALIREMEEHVSASGAQEARELLGEAYTLMGGFHMMLLREDFGECFKKAYELLPNGSNFVGKDRLHNENNQLFSMPDNTPGARERMEQAVQYASQWISKVYNGGFHGIEHLFCAESAFLTYRLEEAQQLAYKAILKAGEKAQHDIVCNAHCLLGRIGFLRGNYKEITEEMDSIVKYADAHPIGVVKEIRDTALAWYYIKMEDLEKAPRWLVTIDEQNAASLISGRTQLIYAHYLICKGEFNKTIALLESQRGLFLTRGIWADRINKHILLAIAYLNIGEQEKAMESLWTAYDLCYNNDLITLFVESGKYMRRLIGAAKKQDKYAFDPKWLDMIYTRASTYAKKLGAVRSVYQAERKQEPSGMQKLTRREQEVLISLAQGLTRDEIALFHDISVNTVKTTITGIYNKLGAINRADAVLIATREGYIM